MAGGGPRHQPARRDARSSDGRSAPVSGHCIPDRFAAGEAKGVGLEWLGRRAGARRPDAEMGT